MNFIYSLHFLLFRELKKIHYKKFGHVIKSKHLGTPNGNINKTDELKVVEKAFQTA